MAIVALALLAVGMQASLRREVELATDRNTEALRVAYASVANVHRLDAATRLRFQLLQPASRAILRQAGQAGPEVLPALGDALARALGNVVDELHDQGVGHVHFHTADCRLLLRLNGPDGDDDVLGEAGPGVCRANASRASVSGFGSGRFPGGYRNILPIIDEGVLLGSLEIIVPFAQIAEELGRLLPETGFTLLLPDPAGSADAMEPVMAMPGAARFGAGYRIVDSWVAPGMRRRLPEADAGLASRLPRGESFSLPVRDADGQEVASFLAVPDLDSQAPAYIVAIARDDTVPVLRRHAWRQGLLIAGLIVLVAGLLHRVLRQNTEIRRQLDQITAVGKSMGEGIYVMDMDGNITMVNDAACQLLEHPREALLGQQAHALFHRHEGNRNLSLDACPIFKTALTSERFVGEDAFITGSGKIVPVQVHSRALRDGERVVGAVTIFSDISERKAREERVHELAFRDSLTRLANRRLFLTRLAQALDALQPPFQLGVLFIDLDLFKPVNDRFGHDAGDKLLQEVAVRMKNCVGGDDLVARTGGDEFVVLLKDLDDVDQARRVGERILQAVEKPFQIQHEEVRISACIGVAASPLHARDQETLLHCADQAMYRAKKNGRGQVLVYDPDWGSGPAAGRILA